MLFRFNKNKNKKNLSTKNHILGKTSNGLVYKCETCDSFHIEYKNFIFNLTIQEFDAFTNYVINLNNEVTYSENYIGKFCKNITIPTKSESLQIILNNEELNELACLFLLNPKDNYKYDMSFKMSYNFSLS